MIYLKWMEKARVTILAAALHLVFSSVMPAGVQGEIIPPDRRIDWSPGIEGGIPNRGTICANVKDAPYNAAGDGLVDDTTAIQNAINACPEGQVVYLPLGTYRVDGTLTMNKGIVLRGDGRGSTTIRSTITSGDSISTGGSGSSFATGILSGYTKGSTSLTLNLSSGFNVGDYVVIKQANDPALVDVDGCNWCGDDDPGHAMAQVVKVTAKNGNVLTINRPLYYSFSQSFQPEIEKLANSVVVSAGIEDLTIDRINQGSDANISWQYCVNCWIRNVESAYATNYHIRIENSYGCVIRDSFVHHGHSYDSDRAYGLHLFGRNSDHLVENNIFYYLRHSMVLEGGGSGNVFGYNYSDRMFDDAYPDTDWLMADLNTHGAHPYMNLFEGNIGNHLSFDVEWGSSSHNTAFRNWLDRESQGENNDITLHHYSVDIHRKNYFHNLVGNVLGVPGDSGNPYRLGCNTDGGSCTTPDANVEATLLRHGNYDYGSLSEQWDPAIDDHNLPDSYYLTSKPAFFKDLPWPPFGPDRSPVAGTIPAKERFLNPLPPETSRPMPPTNPRKVNL